VVTQQQVRKAANAYYRGGMGAGLMAGLPSLAALRRLLYSMATLKFLGKPKR